MTTTDERPPTPAAPPPPMRRRGWFLPLLLRLHFSAAIFVGPFILVAALSGALYAATPQLEKVLYAAELTTPSRGETLPLAEQIEAANAHTAGDDTLVAVRPAPEEGATTRVMYAGDGLGESETRAVFVDPVTAEIRGDLTAYGTSGALPLRTWIDQLHRNLHLGDVGRLYSELAASWLGVIALAGLGLWIARLRRARRKRDLLRPQLTGAGYRRTLSWHTATGIWLLVGALFLSATGITWSQYAGGNVDGARATWNWSTPSLDTDLTGSGTPAGAHDHHGGAAATDGAAPGPANPPTFDAALAIAQRVNVNTGLVEIRPPAAEGSAWVVQEIQRSFPTEVDAVAIDGRSLEVTSRTDFRDFPLAAKLTRWGIDTHMGSMFGLPNQILLVVLAVGIACMTVWGYAMWWQRRPARDPSRLVGRMPARDVLRRAPWWGVTAVVAVAAAVGLLLPLLGISLAAFVLIDILIQQYTDRTTRRKDQAHG